MKLGIMQPYFFPYLGYFSLIASTDEWVVFDITQYTPKSWINRNRVLHPVGGWNYITVPLRNSSISIKINEARIQNVQKVQKQILGKLNHYKKKAPYYSYVESLVNETFANTSDDDSLVNLNIRSIKAVCNYLEIPFKYKICSNMEIPLPQKMPAGKWASTISGLLGASRYINPIGGQGLFDPADFSAEGVELALLEAEEFRYDSGPYEFEKNLSILDVLMWNSPKVVRDAIFRVKIVIPTEFKRL